MTHHRFIEHTLMVLGEQLDTSPDGDSASLALSRSLLALDFMLRASPPVGEEVTSDSHLGVLLTTLRRWALGPEVDERLRSELVELGRALVGLEGPEAPDASVSARLQSLRDRGVGRVAALVQEQGPTLSTEEVAQRLGLTRQAVNRRRQEGRLLAVEVGRGFRYPAWQFAPSGEVLLGMEQVLERLGVPPVMALQWFHTALDAEGTTPIDLLRSGRVAMAVEIAATIGEHGAA